MKQWEYTSYENGKPVVHRGLTRAQAVRAIEDAIAGHTPEIVDEVREPGTAEHRIAA